MAVPIHGKGSARPLPEDFTVPHEWVEVPVEGGTLRGIHAANDGPPVLVLYGAGMNISGTREVVAMLHAAGYSVLCCDYRGTGHSSGRWSSSTLDDDARALWAWLRARGEPAGVLGISVGAIAAAALLTDEHPPAAVVLDRPVDPRTVIRRFLQSNGFHVSALVSTVLVRPSTDVDVRGCLAAARTDALVVLPEDDLLCPPGDAAALVEGRAAKVEVTVVPGGHLNAHLVAPALWRGLVLDFLDARLRPGQPARGRGLPPDPVRVTGARLEGRTLTVDLEPPLPPEITLLALGGRGNALIPVSGPRPHLSLPLSGSEARRLRPLYAVRAVPEGFVATVGTRRYEVAPR